MISKKYEYNKKWRKKNKEKFNETMRKIMRKYRINALKIVGKGNIKCSNCGCDKVEILEINHIKGGGCKELNKGKDSYKFYKNIIKGSRNTDDLNILCHVCNHAYFVKQKYGIEYDIILKPSSIL